MKTFLALLLFVVCLNAVFAVMTMVLFHGQIEGATTLPDYFFYAVSSLTTSDLGKMSPKTTGVRMWTTAYVLLAWVYIFYVTVNHISDVKFKLFG
jgi:hypothetical protein